VASPRDPPEVLERFHSHLDLVEVIARQISRDLGPAAEFDDLRSMGQKGLLDAARRFDEARGVAFRRFANYRVRGAIFDGIRTSAPLPRRAHARLRALEASLLVARTADDDAGSPADNALRSDARAADARLTEHLAVMATAMAIGLLATPAVGDDGESSAMDPALSPEEAVANAELRAIVVQALADLPDDERTMVDRHYLHGERIDLVSASLGLSKSWGSRLHTRAVARLTKRLRGLTL